jgi:hypothetical protein
MIKNGIVFGGALFVVFLLVVASAYGWGADAPAEELLAEDGEVDIDDDHHHRHHRVHHGGYYVPFYSSYGRRGSSRGAGGFRGGK